MPSSSIDNCARVRETVPSKACGQTKRPLSKRLANRHSPSPSNQISFTRSPRRPRKMNTWPESGLSPNLLCTSALSPVKPRRRSVTPAAIHIFVLLGGPIIAPDSPTPHAPVPHRHCLRFAHVYFAVGSESCPQTRIASRQLHLTKGANSPPSLWRATAAPHPAYLAVPSEKVGAS